MAQGSISDLVRAMTPVRYTVKEAAEKVGVSEDTLTRWRKQGVHTPCDSAFFGSLRVFLYSDEDLVELKRIKRSRKPGPKSNV